jgi:hypothetical protein
MAILCNVCSSDNTVLNHNTVQILYDTCYAKYNGCSSEVTVNA